MLDISFGELVLVVAFAVMFIRPEDVPAVLRAMARGYAKLRRMMHELREAFDDIARETGLEEARRDIERQTTLIEGDDGDMYEAYTLDTLKELSPPRNDSGEAKPS